MMVSSFQSYFYNDDIFNFNYAQAKATVGNYKEAEEVSISSIGVHVYSISYQITCKLYIQILTHNFPLMTNIQVMNC